MCLGLTLGVVLRAINQPWKTAAAEGEDQERKDGNKEAPNIRYFPAVYLSDTCGIKNKGLTRSRPRCRRDL